MVFRGVPHTSVGILNLCRVPKVSLDTLSFYGVPQASVGYPKIRFCGVPQTSLEYLQPPVYPQLLWGTSSICMWYPKPLGQSNSLWGTPNIWGTPAIGVPQSYVGYPYDFAGYPKPSLRYPSC